MGHHVICADAVAHKYAPLAQLDRVADFESVGRGFESLRAHQNESLASIVFARLCYFPVIVYITPNWDR